MGDSLEISGYSPFEKNVVYLGDEPTPETMLLEIGDNMAPLSRNDYFQFRLTI